MSCVLRYFREGHETVEITFGNGMHEGKATFESVHDEGARYAAKVGEADRLLAERVREALELYYKPEQDISPSLRLDRLEAFAAELVSGAFPHLAHIVPVAHLGDAVKALRGEP